MNLQKRKKIFECFFSTFIVLSFSEVLSFLKITAYKVFTFNHLKFGDKGVRVLGFHIWNHLPETLISKSLDNQVCDI